MPGRSIAVAIATAATLWGGAAQAQTHLKVVVFPGMSNLMQFAAQSQGFSPSAASLSN